MTIRRAASADIGAILEFWPASGASPSPTDTAYDLHRMLGRDDALLLVAVDDDRVVGTVIATFDGWRGHIYRLAVAPAERRRGIGRGLVDRAEEWLRDAGAKRVIALVELDHPWAIDFWKAIGYPHDPSMQRHVKALHPQI